MITFVADARGKLAKQIAARGVAYTEVRKLLRNKDVKVNGKRTNSDITCEKGDLIEVYYEPRTYSAPAPEYSDDNILIMNKPSGVSFEDFFAAVKAAHPSASAVHRLDRNTCGLVVFAQNPVAEAELLYGFKNRTFKKFYLAEVKGVPEPPSAVLEAYLYKDAENSFVHVSNQPGEGRVKIKTAYKTREKGDLTSVLEVDLITGRTHQIRAHLAYAGYPIVGDEKYGDADFNKTFHAKRQRLQAYEIIFYFSPSSPLAYLNGKKFTVPEEISL